tara:strand:- start:15789 stop:16232 length:444 start_codon:yes stop_codon:yes gene_type:complete
MIRKANIDDLSSIVALCTMFFNESKTGLTPVLSRSKAYDVIKEMIDSDMCILHIAECKGSIVGMIGAIVSPHWFSDELVSQELFWYVLPEFRGLYGVELLKSMEERSKELGASLISMVDLGERSPVDVLLKRNNYSIHEKTYIKRAS